jgi:hypothetical protein
VEVVRFILPPVLERLLRVEHALSQKARLPASVGLGPDGRHLWRWRSDLADRFANQNPVAGTARAVGPQGILAGFALHRTGEPSTRLSASVVWLERDGSWTEAPETLARWLTQASEATAIARVDARDLQSWLPLLSAVVRDRVALTHSRRWLAPNPTPPARRLAARLQSLIQDAARRHQPARLVRLERAMEFVAGGHTAGEEALVEQLAEADDQQLIMKLDRLPKPPGAGDGIEVRLTGLVIFGPDDGAGRKSG